MVHERTKVFAAACIAVVAAAGCSPNPSPDRGPRSPTGAGSAGAERVSAKDFQCNLLLGVGVTSEWFGAGFETTVDDSRWEAIVKPHTALEQWADPADPVWSLSPSSACAARAANPDRVLFTGMNWDYTTAGEWVTKLSSVVQVIKTRYAGVRRIELLTMIRAPGNTSCGNPMSVVQPFIDEAVRIVCARNPGLVQAGPRFEVKSCDVFKKGGPHFTAEGGAIVAKLIGDFYAAEP